MKIKLFTRDEKDTMTSQKKQIIMSIVDFKLLDN